MMALTAAERQAAAKARREEAMVLLQEENSRLREENDFLKRRVAHLEQADSDSDDVFNTMMEQGDLLNDYTEEVRKQAADIEFLQERIARLLGVRERREVATGYDSVRSREWAVVAREKAIAEREAMLAEKEAALPKEVAPKVRVVEDWELGTASSDLVQERAGIFDLAIAAAKSFMAGKTVEEIAASYGMVEGTVEYLLEVAGFPQNPQKPRFRESRTPLEGDAK